MAPKEELCQLLTIQCICRSRQMPEVFAKLIKGRGAYSNVSYKTHSFFNDRAFTQACFLLECV